MRISGARPKLESPPGVVLARGDLAGLDSLSVDTIAVFCFSDVRPLGGVAGFVDWRVCGALSRSIESGTFSGRRGEILMLPASGRFGVWRLFVFGLGTASECNRLRFREVCREAHRVLESAGAGGVGGVVFAAPSAHCPNAGNIEREFVLAVSAELPGKLENVLVEG